MKKLEFTNLHLLGSNGEDEYLFRDSEYNQIWIKIKDLVFKLNYKYNKEHGAVITFAMKCHKTSKGTLIADEIERVSID